MFKKVLLTKEEKKVIKKVTRVQINNLTNIYNKDCSIDITLECLRDEIDEKEFLDKVLTGINIFKIVHENPRELFNLDTNKLSTVRHILVHYANHPKYDEGKRKVWKKLFIIEELPLCKQ